MTAFTESIVEEAVLDWLRELGYAVISGQDALPAAGDALRATYGDVVLPGAPRSALHRLNPALPVEALDEAFRKLSGPEGPTAEAQWYEATHLRRDSCRVYYGYCLRGQVRTVRTLLQKCPTLSSGYSAYPGQAFNLKIVTTQIPKGCIHQSR